MNEMDIARICDAIIRKFNGNVSFTWDAIHEESFYKPIHENFYEVENRVFKLLGDGVLQRSKEDILSLTNKGRDILTDMPHLSYVKLLWKKRVDYMLSLIIPIVISLIIMIISDRKNTTYLDAKIKEVQKSMQIIDNKVNVLNLRVHSLQKDAR